MDLDPNELERLVPRSARAEGAARARRGDTTLGTEPEPLRPWSVGEVLDVALDLMRQRFALYAGTCMLLWFPLRVAMPFIAMHTWLQSGELPIAAGGLFMLVAMLGGLVTMLAEAVVAQLALATLEDRALSLGEALTYTARRFWAIFGLALLYGTLVYVGTACCLVVPGVLLAWKFWLAKPALILERVPLSSAIQRSFELSRGTLWRWLGVASTRLFFTMVLSSTVGLPDDPTFRGALLEAVPISGTVLDVINVCLSSIFLGTVTALSAVLVTVFYVDCRVRRDGFDLHLQLDRIEAERGPAASAGAAS